MTKKVKKLCETEGLECCHNTFGRFVGCYDPAKCQSCDPAGEGKVITTDKIIEECKDCQALTVGQNTTYNLIPYCKEPFQGCCFGACYDKVCEICNENTQKVEKKSDCVACCRGSDVGQPDKASICFDPNACEQCVSQGNAGFYVKDLTKRIIPGTTTEETDPCVKCENGNIVPFCATGSYCCECGSTVCCEGCEYCDRTDPNNPSIYDGPGCDPGVKCCDGECYDPSDPQYKYCYECLTKPNSNPPKAEWREKCLDRTDGKTSCCNGTCYDPNGCKKCSDNGSYLENKSQAGWVCCTDPVTNLEKFVQEKDCCGGTLLGGSSTFDKCCNNQPYNSLDGTYDCCEAIFGGGPYNTLTEGCCNGTKYLLSEKICCDQDTLFSRSQYTGCCGKQGMEDHQDCCNGQIYNKKCQVCINNEKLYDTYNKKCNECHPTVGIISKLGFNQGCCQKAGWNSGADGDPGAGPYIINGCENCDTSTGELTKSCPPKQENPDGTLVVIPGKEDETECCLSVSIYGSRPQCYSTKNHPCRDCIDGKIVEDKCKYDKDGNTDSCQYGSPDAQKCECYKKGCKECTSDGVVDQNCSENPGSNPAPIYSQNLGGRISYYGAILKDSCCSSSLTGDCYSSVCEDCLNNTVLIKKADCESCCNNRCCKTICCEVSQNKFLCCDDKGPNPDCCVFENGNKDCCKTGKCCAGDNKCCSDSEDCTNGKCCPIGEIAYGPDKICCLPEKWCAATNTCCSGEQICCDGACVDPKECCNGIRCPSGEVCCGSSGCVPSNECCGNKPFDPTGCQKCVNDTPIDDCPFVNGVRLPCCQGTNGSPGQCYDPNNCEKCSSGVKVPYVPSNPDCYCLNGTEICNCIIVPLTWSFDEACSYCVNYGSGSISSSNGNVWDLNGMSSSFTSPYSYPGNMMITVNCSDGNDYIVWTGTSVPNGTLTGIPTSLPSNPCCP